MNNNNTKKQIMENLIRLPEKVARLEENDKRLEGKIEDLFRCFNNLRDNHIHSIYRKIDEINQRMDMQKNWIIGILVTMIFTLVGVIISIFT